jgi:hypothetical protein
MTSIDPAQHAIKMYHTCTNPCYCHTMTTGRTNWMLEQKIVSSYQTRQDLENDSFMKPVKPTNKRKMKILKGIHEDAKMWKISSITRCLG